MSHCVPTASARAAQVHSDSRFLHRQGSMLVSLDESALFTVAPRRNLVSILDHPHLGVSQSLVSAAKGDSSISRRCTPVVEVWDVGGNGLKVQGTAVSQSYASAVVGGTSWWDMMLYGLVFGVVVSDDAKLNDHGLHSTGTTATSPVQLVGADASFTTTSDCSEFLQSDAPASESAFNLSLSMSRVLGFYSDIFKALWLLGEAFLNSSWVHAFYALLAWRACTLLVCFVLLSLVVALYESAMASVRADYARLITGLQAEVRRAHRSAKRNAKQLAKLHSFKYRRTGRLTRRELRELQAHNLVAQDYPAFRNFVFVGTWFDTHTGWAKCTREGCTCVSYNGEPGKFCSLTCRDTGVCGDRAHRTPSGLAPRVQGRQATHAAGNRPRRSPRASSAGSTSHSSGPSSEASSPPMGTPVRGTPPAGFVSGTHDWMLCQCPKGCATWLSYAGSMPTGMAALCAKCRSGPEGSWKTCECNNDNCCPNSDMKCLPCDPPPAPQRAVVRRRAEGVMRRAHALTFLSQCLCFFTWCVPVGGVELEEEEEAEEMEEEVETDMA